MEKIKFPEINEADLFAAAATEADLLAAAATEADLLAAAATEEDFFGDSTKGEEAMNQKILTPLKSIRAKCLECSNGSFAEVRLCPIVDCNLYAFRLGRNPNIKKRELSPEQRKALAERLQKKPTGHSLPSPASDSATN